MQGLLLEFPSVCVGFLEVVPFLQMIFQYSSSIYLSILFCNQTHPIYVEMLKSVCGK